VNSRLAQSLALTRFLGRSLARAGYSQPDVHLLLFATRFHDERHAGWVIDPVPAGVSQPPGVAGIGAVGDEESVAGGGRVLRPIRY